MKKPESLVARVFKNTVFSSLARFSSGVSGFIVTPFLLRYLGLKIFGVWSFLFIIIAYLNLLDLGFAEATIKFTAEYWAQKKEKAVFNLFSLSFLFYLSLAFLLLIFYFPAASWLAELIPLPPNTPLGTDKLFLIAIVYVILTKITNIIISIFAGLQKMEIVALNQFIYDLFIVVSVLIIIYTRQAACFIFWVPVFARTFLLFAQIFMVKIIIPGFIFDFSLISKSFLKRILRMSAGVQMGISANILTTQIAKSLISTLGFSYLGIYELAFKAVAFLKALPTVFLQPLFPAISELDVLDKNKRNRLISQGTKYLSFFTYPLFFLSFVFMPQMMRLWLGKDIALAIFAARILLIGFLPDTIIGVISTAINGVGKVFIHVEYAILILVLNSLGMYFLLKFSDFKLLLYVFPAAIFAGFLWKLYRFSKKILRLTFRFYAKNFAHSFFISLFAGIFSFFLSKLFLYSFSDLIIFIGGCFIFGIFYLILLLLTGFFVDEDWRIFKKSFCTLFKIF